jgi:hypothetical protein
LGKKFIWQKYLKVIKFWWKQISNNHN